MYRFDRVRNAPGYDDGAVTPEERTQPAADYDSMGAAYAANADTNPYNALYDRPAVLELAGDVAGLRVLDAGCAAGALSNELAGRGAEIVGVDASERMIAIARERLEGKGLFAIADLERPMPFLADASFDLVTASLVLHYLRDWRMPLTEFRRVLRPSGRLVITTHHPAARFATSPHGKYHTVEPITEEWVKEGRAFEVHWYRRPLSKIIGPIIDAGFTIERLVEPLPRPEMRASHPDVWEKLTNEPWFLGISAVPSETGPPG